MIKGITFISASTLRETNNYANDVIVAISELTEQNQDQHYNEDEAEPAAAIVAGPVKRAATETAETPE
jgi:hypothetical protein